MCLKRIYIFLLNFIFLFSFLTDRNSLINAQTVSVSAKSACLVISDSCEVLFAKNENECLPMASTTKIMTSLLALESLEACGDKEIEITDEMVRVEGTSMGLMPGDVVNLEALAKGMLLCSGNDAANAAAIAVGGDKDKFISLMNERARQIGMNNTRFVTPSGLDSGDHHSTAYDMALLGAFAMENNRFASIASKKSDKVVFINPQKTVSFRNHNKLLRLYDGCIGVKTGFTKAAGRCLVSCAQKNGVKLVAVTLNAPSDWEDHKNMFNYGFEKTVSVDFDDKSFKTVVRVHGGDIDEIKVCSASSFSRSFVKGNEAKVKRVVDIPDCCEAPIEKGQVVGRILYYFSDKEIGRNDIVAECSVNKIEKNKGFWNKIKEFFKGIFNNNI